MPQKSKVKSTSVTYESDSEPDIEIPDKKNGKLESKGNNMVPNKNSKIVITKTVEQKYTSDTDSDSEVTKNPKIVTITKTIKQNYDTDSSDSDSDKKLSEKKKKILNDKRCSEAALSTNGLRKLNKTNTTKKSNDFYDSSDDDKPSSSTNSKSTSSFNASALKKSASAPVKQSSSNKPSSLVDGQKSNDNPVKRPPLLVDGQKSNDNSVKQPSRPSSLNKKLELIDNQNSNDELIKQSSLTKTLSLVNSQKSDDKQVNPSSRPSSINKKSSSVNNLMPPLIDDQSPVNKLATPPKILQQGKNSVLDDDSDDDDKKSVVSSPISKPNESESDSSESDSSDSDSSDSDSDSDSEKETSKKTPVKTSSKIIPSAPIKSSVPDNDNKKSVVSSQISKPDESDSDSSDSDTSDSDSSDSDTENVTPKKTPVKLPLKTVPNAPIKGRGKNYIDSDDDEYKDVNAEPPYSARSENGKEIQRAILQSLKSNVPQNNDYRDKNGVLNISNPDTSNLNDDIVRNIEDYGNVHQDIDFNIENPDSAENQQLLLDSYVKNSQTNRAKEAHLLLGKRALNGISESVSSTNGTDMPKSDVNVRSGRNLGKSNLLSKFSSASSSKDTSKQSPTLDDNMPTLERRENTSLSNSSLKGSSLGLAPSAVNSAKKSTPSSPLRQSSMAPSSPLRQNSMAPSSPLRQSSMAPSEVNFVKRSSSPSSTFRPSSLSSVRSPTLEDIDISKLQPPTLQREHYHESLGSASLKNPALGLAPSRVSSSQAPSSQAPSPRAPSPRAPSPRAPSPRAPSPRAPSPRAPSPRAAPVRANSGRGSLLQEDDDKYDESNFKSIKINGENYNIPLNCVDNDTILQKIIDKEDIVERKFIKCLPLLLKCLHKIYNDGNYNDYESVPQPQDQTGRPKSHNFDKEPFHKLFPKIFTESEFDDIEFTTLFLEMCISIKHHKLIEITQFYLASLLHEKGLSSSITEVYKALHHK
jgi:hypothetical protein